MEMNDFVHQMIKFNQSLFNSTFETSVQFQNQVEKAGNSMMDQVEWLPGEGRKIYETAMEAYKAGRSNFKTYIDEGFHQAGNLFS